MRAASVTKVKCANPNTIANPNTNPVPNTNPNVIPNPNSTNTKLQVRILSHRDQSSVDTVSSALSSRCAWSVAQWCNDDGIGRMTKVVD